MSHTRLRDKTKLVALAVTCLAGQVLGAEPEADPAELPRLPPTQPAEALDTFQVAPGYRIELVAAEPLVADPVAMAFDEKQRLFVVEMRGYSERRDEKLGRIRLLTDDDGDGKFDRASTYADGLPWPTAVIAWDGGVFVAASPDIYYFKDSDGDGEADVKETVFTGFGTGVRRLNVQALVNNLKWGPDGRIHGATAGNGGRVVRADHPEGEATELRGLDFSFDPVRLDLRAENGGGQYGLSFNSSGEKFVCSNSNHIQQVMYPRRYAGAPMRPARTGIADDGPAAEVFRRSKDEPWRVVRTRWRVSGQVKGIVEGGGRVSGYFTSAAGIEIHRGQAFICDVGSNLVHRKELYTTPESPRTKARRPAGEEAVEFLASTDNWFRPVQLISSPDGALYIADMYREVIEHPWSIPASIKKHLDLNSGNDRGRIYRIIPEEYQQVTPADLTTLESRELVDRLDGPGGHLVAAVLRTRKDPEIISALELHASDRDSARALQLLQVLGELDQKILVGALSSTSTRTQKQALVSSETLDPLPAEARHGLAALATSPSPEVRYQLALTLGLRDGSWRIPIIADLLSQPADEWLTSAALKALGGSAGSVFTSLTGSDDPPDTALLASLATIIGEAENPSEIKAVRDYVAGSPGEQFQILSALVAGMSQTDAPWINQAITGATSIASDRNAATAERLGAIRLISICDPRSAALADLFESSVEPEILTGIAMGQTGAGGSVDWARRLISRWDDLPPSGKIHAINAMGEPRQSKVLLEAIETGKIAPGAISRSAIDHLRKSPDSGVREQANRLFPGPAGNRLDVVEKYQPALKLAGDPDRGREIYTARCMICHRAGKRGFAYGPDVESFRSSGKQTILGNIIAPNRETPPQYAMHLITLRNGNTVAGIIADQGDQQIRLTFPAGVERSIKRSEVKSIERLPNSPMPEQLESGLDQQQMADLLKFLTDPE